MKLSSWIMTIGALIGMIVVYLWYSGRIEKYLLRRAIEQGDQATMLKLLRKGVRPDFYNR